MEGDRVHVERTNAHGDQGQADQLHLSLDEIIATTVRAINLQNKTRISNEELKALIPEFSGSTDEDINQWFQRIDAIRRMYEVNDNSLLLTIISKLKGTALNWFHSKPSHVTYDLAQLKTEMSNIFETKEDSIMLMRKFEKRRWRKNEKFSEYYMDKTLLGNKLNLAEKDLITYIIEGMDNPHLQSIAKMKEFMTLNHLLRVMNDVTNTERPTLCTTCY